MTYERVLSGLCSVSFRKLSPEEVVRVCSEAGLEAIEWGGDVHAPPDLPPERLREIRSITEKAGLAVSSYGSYFRLCESGREEFERVLEAGTMLGVPIIRIWSTRVSSAEANVSDWRRSLEEAQELAEIAEKRGLKLAFEFHQGCLTDNAESVVRLISSAHRPNLLSYYQVNFGGRHEPLDELAALLPYLANLHIHYYREGEQLPLAEGEECWLPLLKLLARDGKPRTLLIEFVRGGSRNQFLKDARTLLEWMKKVGLKA